MSQWLRALDSAPVESGFGFQYPYQAADKRL